MICTILGIIIYLLISYGIITIMMQSRKPLDKVDKILYVLSPIVFPLVVIVTIVFKIKDLLSKK